MLRPVTLGYSFTIFFFEENCGARYVSLACRISRYTKVSIPLRARQRFVVRPPVSGLAPRKSRSRTIDLRSDRPAGVYETIRHGRDAFIYPHRGSRQSPRLPLISKTRGFVAPVTQLACEFSKVVNALLNSRLGTHFAISCRNAWRQSASTVTQCTLRVIGEHVHPDTAR